MKTVFIYDQFSEDSLKFFELDGDYSHLDRTYINADGDEDNIDELNKILFNQDDGSYIVDLSDTFPIQLDGYGYYHVIVVGFVP